MHADLLRLLEVSGDLPWQSPTNLYAVAYRVAGANGVRSLEIWSESLALGRMSCRDNCLRSGFRDGLRPGDLRPELLQ